MTFLDSLGMISYSLTIHFIALKPNVSKILSLKIKKKFFFHTSAVLKLLQQKYKSEEDAIHKCYKQSL
jgi:hypothetical protein